MRKSEAAVFQRLLLRIREALLSDVNHLTDKCLRINRKESSGDLSSMPIHMADLGSDNFEHEFSFSLLENEEDKLAKIDAALARVTGGTFGKCEVCGCIIPKERLKAIPWTPHCVNCARETEEAS